MNELPFCGQSFRRNKARGHRIGRRIAIIIFLIGTHSENSRTMELVQRTERATSFPIHPPDSPAVAGARRKYAGEIVAATAPAFCTASTHRARPVKPDSLFYFFIAQALRRTRLEIDHPTGTAGEILSVIDVMRRRSPARPGEGQCGLSGESRSTGSPATPPTPFPASETRTKFGGQANGEQECFAQTRAIIDLA